MSDLFMCGKCGLELVSPLKKRAHAMTCTGDPPDETAPLQVDPRDIPRLLQLLLTEATSVPAAEQATFVRSQMQCRHPQLLPTVDTGRRSNQRPIQLVLLARAFDALLQRTPGMAGQLIALAVKCAEDFLIPASLPIAMAAAVGLIGLIQPLLRVSVPNIFGVRFSEETCRRIGNGNVHGGMGAELLEKVCCAVRTHPIADCLPFRRDL